MIRAAIDTSVLVGLLDPKDVWHAPAILLKEALKTSGAQVAMLDCVLAEAISTMARRIHEQRRAADLDELMARVIGDYPPDDILWVFPDVPALYGEIIELVRSSRGELNFNDALIALSCRYRDVPLVASFDPDFDQLSWLRRVTTPDDLARLPFNTP